MQHFTRQYEEKQQEPLSPFCKALKLRGSAQHYSTLFFIEKL